MPSTLQVLLLFFCLGHPLLERSDIRSSSFRYFKGSLRNIIPCLLSLSVLFICISSTLYNAWHDIYGMDWMNEYLHFRLPELFSYWFWYLSFLLKCELSSLVAKITFYGSWHAPGLLFLCLTCRSELDHEVVTLTDAYQRIQWNQPFCWGAHSVVQETSLLRQNRLYWLLMAILEVCIKCLESTNDRDSSGEEGNVVIKALGKR